MPSNVESPFKGQLLCDTQSRVRCRNSVLRRSLWLCTYFALSAFIVVNVFGQDRPVHAKVFSPDHRSWVTYNGQPHGDFEAKIHDGLAGTDETLYQGPSVTQPEVTWYNNAFVRVMMSAGSPGDFSVLCDVRQHARANVIWYIVAVNPANEYILVARETVWIQKAFGPTRRMNLHLDFYNSAIKTLIFENGTYFDSFGNLHLVFLNSKKSIETKIVNDNEIRKVLNAEN